LKPCVAIFGLAFAGSLGAATISPLAADELGRRIASQGNGRGAPACESCHGADGLGNAAAGFPRLAGLNAAYLVRQLDDYENGTRNNAVMGTMAKTLAPDERKAIAAYYAALPVPSKAPRAGNDSAQLVRGQRLAEQGAWSKGIPACYRCHGENGEGIAPHFPAIVDQPASYIAAQFTAWKGGTRSNDPLGLMKAVAVKLDDEEIASVAAWLAANSLLPPRGRAQR
jgi:cytochrome c553